MQISDDLRLVNELNERHERETCAIPSEQLDHVSKFAFVYGVYSETTSSNCDETIPGQRWAAGSTSLAEVMTSPYGLVQDARVAISSVPLLRTKRIVMMNRFSWS